MVRTTMAKKEAEGPQWKELLRETISSTIINKIKEIFKDVMERTQAFIRHTEKKVVEGLYASMLLFCGLVFVFISAALAINNYFALNSQWGFFITGVAVIFLALLFKDYIKRTRQFKE